MSSVVEDGRGRRLLAALADDAPAFRSRVYEPGGGWLRRLLIALADAAPAFTPRGLSDSYRHEPSKSDLAAAEARNFARTGRKLFILQKFMEAEAAFRDAVRLEPDKPIYHAELGRVLAAQNRVTEAADAFQAALRLEPDNPAYQAGLGRWLAAQSRATEAEAAFRTAVRLEPGNPTYHAGLGRALAAQSRSTEAEAAFRIAIRLEPGNPKYQGELGRVLAAQDRLDEAAEAFRGKFFIRFNSRITKLELKYDKKARKAKHVAHRARTVSMAGAYSMLAAAISGMVISFFINIADILVDTVTPILLTIIVAARVVAGSFDSNFRNLRSMHDELHLFHHAMNVAEATDDLDTEIELDWSRL